VGELLLERHYGDHQLERQRPLAATDMGDHWRVEGSWNRDGQHEGFGPFFLSIAKFDGRVSDFGVLGAYHPDPAAIALIKGDSPPEMRYRLRAPLEEQWPIGLPISRMNIE
jgi:hypothetical protein